MSVHYRGDFSGVSRRERIEGERSVRQGETTRRPSSPPTFALLPAGCRLRPCLTPCRSPCTHCLWSTWVSRTGNWAGSSGQMVPETTFSSSSMWFLESSRARASRAVVPRKGIARASCLHSTSLRCWNHGLSRSPTAEDGWADIVCRIWIYTSATLVTEHFCIQIPAPGTELWPTGFAHYLNLQEHQ
jgi:hypothetical protein